VALQIGAIGAGIRIAHAPMQPHLFGLGVQAKNLIAVGVPMDQGKRGINRTCAQNPLAGQPWKPQ